MAIKKCKMCGGDLNQIGGSTITTCEFCGTTQTVTSADNDKKLTLFAEPTSFMRPAGPIRWLASMSPSWPMSPRKPRPMD